MLLKFVGLDKWLRPVYKDQYSKLWKCISLLKEDDVFNSEKVKAGGLFSSVDNEFNGEPLWPSKESEIQVVTPWMSMEAYMNKYDELKEGDEEELYKFQETYMYSVLADLKEKNEHTKSMNIIFQIVKTAIKESISGNVEIYLSDYIEEDEREPVFKELTENGLLWEKLGDYLLDDESYFSKEDGYIIDVMFGGAFVPGWE